MSSINLEFAEETESQQEQLTFDYSVFTVEERETVHAKEAEIRTLPGKEHDNAFLIGERLFFVRNLMRARGVKGQGFQQWLRQNFSMSRKTAYRFISVYETFKECVIVTQRLSPTALYLLSSGTCPKSVRRYVVEQVEQGEMFTHQDIRELIQESKGTLKPRWTPGQFVEKIEEAFTYWQDEQGRVQGNHDLTDESIYPDRKTKYKEDLKEISGKLWGLGFVKKLFACVQRGENPLLIAGDFPNEFCIELGEISQKWGDFDEYAIEIEEVMQ